MTNDELQMLLESISIDGDLRAAAELQSYLENSKNLSAEELETFRKSTENITINEKTSAPSLWLKTLAYDLPLPKGSSLYNLVPIVGGLIQKESDSKNQNFALTISAKYGYPPAYYQLGRQYEKQSNEVPSTFSQALNYYEEASTNGFSLASLKLGTIYQEGIGPVKIDIEKAIIYFHRAYQQGDASVLYKIVDCIDPYSETHALLCLIYLLEYNNENSEVSPNPCFEKTSLEAVSQWAQKVYRPENISETQIATLLSFLESKKTKSDHNSHIEQSQQHLNGTKTAVSSSSSSTPTFSATSAAANQYDQRLFRQATQETSVSSPLHSEIRSQYRYI